jgi:hypothetical protein
VIPGSGNYGFAGTIEISAVAWIKTGKISLCSSFSKRGMKWQKHENLEI